MFGLGVGEIAVILAIALIFIGPKKLPELAKGLGRGIREFQKAKDDILDHVKNPTDDDDCSTNKLAESDENKISNEKSTEDVRPDDVSVEGVIARGTTVKDTEDKKS